MFSFRSLPNFPKTPILGRRFAAVAFLVLITLRSVSAQQPKAGVEPAKGSHPLATELLRNIGNNNSLIAWMINADIQDRDGDGIPIVIKPVLAELEAKFAPGDDRLLHAICSVGSTTEFLNETPTNDWAKIRQALKSIQSVGTGVDDLYIRVEAPAIKYRRYQTSDKRKLILVLVSHEIDDDEYKAEEASRLFARNHVTFHAVATIAY